MENTPNGSTVLGVFTTDEQAENAVLTYYGQEYIQASFKRVDDSGLCWVKTLTSKTDVFIKQAVQSNTANLIFTSEDLSTYWCKHGLVFNKELFVKAMQKRNFSVMHVYDDRPSGGYYYKVSARK